MGCCSSQNPLQVDLQNFPANENTLENHPDNRMRFNSKLQEEEISLNYDAYKINNFLIDQKNENIRHDEKDNEREIHLIPLHIDHRPDPKKVHYLEKIPDYSNRQTTNTLSRLGPECF
jgi:hypothetical protein